MNVPPPIEVVIYHNPACGTSRDTLSLLRSRGCEPRIVEYLKTPLTAAQLRVLLSELAMDARALLRDKEALYEELNLAAGHWTEDELLHFLAQHPRLMNRPVVQTPLGTRLCRPKERVFEILPAA